jgi:hypothetical protein
MSRTSTATPVPTPSIDADLRKLMRTLKLGRMLDTLLERLALATQQSLPYVDFLSLVFADEVERRDRTSADLRARAAKLDPAMRLETFNPDSPVRYETPTARSATTSSYGTSCARCGSSTTPAGR